MKHLLTKRHDLNNRPLKTNSHESLPIREFTSWFSDVAGLDLDTTQIGTTEHLTNKFGSQIKI